MSSSSSGTSAAAMRWARPSAMAVLPYAGLTDQHGVVLGAAGQDLDDPLDLLLPADDGSSLPLRAASVRSRVYSSRGPPFLPPLLCGSGSAAGHGGGAGRLSLSFFTTALYSFLGSMPTVRRDAQGHVVALPQQPHQQMLGADIAGAGAGGLGNGQLHGTLGTGASAPERVRRRRRRCPTLRCRMSQTNSSVSPFSSRTRWAMPLLFPQQAQQQVLGAHIAMSHILSGLLGQTQSLLCTRGEFIFHHKETLPFKRCGDLPKLLPGHYC